MLFLMVRMVFMVLIQWFSGYGSAAEFLLTPGFQLLAQTDRRLDALFTPLAAGAVVVFQPLAHVCNHCVVLQLSATRFVQSFHTLVVRVQKLTVVSGLRVTGMEVT